MCVYAIQNYVINLCKLLTNDALKQECKMSESTTFLLDLDCLSGWPLEFILY